LTTQNIISFKSRSNNNNSKSVTNQKTKIPMSSSASTSDVPAATNKMSLAKKYLLAVNFFIETNRMEPFVAVYFVVIKGWDEYRIGIISAAMNLAAVIFQVPAGDFIDKTSYKKSTAVVAILVASVTTACVAWTSTFWVVLIAKVFEGIAAAVFLPSLMSFVFGICIIVAEIPKFIATTEISNKIGSALFTLGCGLIAYYLYPNVESIFYLLGAGGIMAALFVALIPSSAIDTNRARQLRREAVGEAVNDDEVVSSDESRMDKGENNPEAMSYKTLLKDKKVLAFAAVTFFYHFANASVVPLVTQYISIDDKRTAMTFTSVALLLFYLFQALTNLVLRNVIEKVTPKTLLIFAHFVLLVRCAMIVILIEWWDNKYALTATQVMDGIGAGIYDTLIPIVVGQATEGSGRFGFTYGINLTCWRIGHAASFALGEFIAYAISYKVAFLIQGGIGIFSLLLLITIVHLPPLAPNKIRRFNPNFDEEAMRVAFRKRVLNSLNEMGGNLSIDGLYEVFKSIDGIDGNGTLDRVELRLFLEKASLAGDEVKKHIDSDILFDDIDVSRDGKIQFVEFILYLEDIHGEDFSPQIKLLQEKSRRAVGNAVGKGFTSFEELTQDDLKQVFKNIDDDNSMSLCKEELRQFLHTNDVVMSVVELDVFYRFMDADEEGGIDFSEFITFLKVQDSTCI